MSIDTIVYEQSTQSSKIAAMGKGNLLELEIVDYSKACEGNIYLGRILHKIDLANGKIGFFVDIADTKEAFINADEFGMEELSLNEGQDVVVQIAQEQRAEKGAKLTRNLQFVGEDLVYCPYRRNIEVSSKIQDREKADEYQGIIADNSSGQEGWIVRTSAINVDAADLILQMKELRARFDKVMDLAPKAKAPTLLQAKENPLFDYINRNLDSIEKVVVNARNMEAQLQERYENLQVELLSKPFEEYGIDEAIGEALQKTVYLKSGGRITIEETKACVAIDVDSGDDKANGSFNRLNNEAALEIAKQIRLRNLSGKIIIDFAGMSEYRYLKTVIEILEQELQKDYIKSSCFGLSRGGNVEVVRMRRRPSLSDLLSAECASCQGTGRVEK